MSNTIEAPIFIDEFGGTKSVNVKTSMTWSEISGVTNKGFIPSLDLLEEINDRVKESLENSIDSYDTGEIGTVELRPDDQEVVSVEVDLV